MQARIVAFGTSRPSVSNRGSFPPGWSGPSGEPAALDRARFGRGGRDGTLLAAAFGGTPFVGHGYLSVNDESETAAPEGFNP
jgi:hypothetical protein